MGVRRNFSRGEQCQQFAKLSQVAKDAAMQMDVRETLFRYYTTTPQENALCYSGHKKCASLAT